MEGQSSNTRFSQLDNLIKTHYELSKAPPELDESVNSLKTQLEEYLSKSFEQPVRLDIFGSLLNGFGSRDSDIDVCLRFENEDVPEITVKALMYRAAHYLRFSGMVRTAQPIPWAKVPIIKIEVETPLKIDMDMSYDNTLALENTKLLAAYCQWEPERLPQLGLWIKKWAKAGGICNSMAGYFSSYGCILMLIYYLQNCKPPVLPRLQEDFDQSKTIHTSGWNTYFYPEVKPNWSRNTQSVGELFLGFLDYYIAFDVKTYVVQVRRIQRLPKSEKKAEKNWKCPMYTWAIEDPFELSRNVSRGVNPRKCKRIVMYMRKTAEKFRNTKFEEIPGYKDDFSKVLDELLASCFVEDNKKKKKKSKKSTTLGEAENLLENEGHSSDDDEVDTEDEIIIAQVEEKKIQRHTMKKTKLAGAGQIDFETKAQRRAVEQMDSLLNALYLERQNFPMLQTPDEPLLFQEGVPEQQSPTSSVASKTYGDIVKTKKKKNKVSKLARKYVAPQQLTQISNQEVQEVKAPEAAKRPQNAWNLAQTDFSPKSSTQPTVWGKPSSWAPVPQQTRKSIWSSSLSDFPPIMSSDAQISAPRALVPPRTPWTSSVEDFPPIGAPKSPSESSVTASRTSDQFRTPKQTPERNAWGKRFSQSPPQPSDIAAHCPFKTD